MQEDPRVRAIIENLINAGKVSGLLNRNPTISYESMLYVKVTKCTSGFSLTINSWCLNGLGADFDGDTLNFLMIYNEAFRNQCEQIYSPRNAFCISRDDGMLNRNVNIFKDTMINMSTLVDMCRENYADGQLAKIKALQEKYKGKIIC
jgi:hypothetical protein